MLASLLESSGVQESPQDRRRRPVTDAELQVVKASGEVLTLDTEDWALDRGNHRVYFVTHQDESLESVHGVVETDPPVSVHVPMGSLTAADNRDEKTEKIGRTPMDVIRYSLITNASNNPDKPHNFDPGIIELWLDEQAYLWPDGFF